MKIPEGTSEKKKSKTLKHFEGISGEIQEGIPGEFYEEFPVGIIQGTPAAITKGTLAVISDVIPDASLCSPGRISAGTTEENPEGTTGADSFTFARKPSRRNS